MKLRQAALASLASIFFTATANATVFFIDEFQVTRNGVTNWFVDDFDGGSVPPDGPEGSATYFTNPTPLPGPEQNSRVEMDTADGAPNISAVTGTSTLFQRARLATSRNDANDDGLKENSTFEVRGLFDLIEPTVNREAYGIRLVDFGAADPNDNVQLRVQKNAAGQWGVTFIEADFGLGVFDTIDGFLLSDITGVENYDQIALTLIKSNDADKLISAAVELIDLDGSNRLVTLDGTAEIFDGERWTRAAFLAIRVVPAPATLLLIGLGMAGIGYQRRKQLRTA